MRIPTSARAWIAALCLLLASASSLAVSATPAAASVGCSGDSCSGQDPVATGCSTDAYTITSVDVPDYPGQLQLRYSPTCGTNWARVVTYPTGWHFFLPIDIAAIQDTGYTQGATTDILFPRSSSETFYTPMIYSPIRCVKATAVSTSYDFFEDGNGTTTAIPDPQSVETGCY
jgi:hypothetical protein